MSAMNNPARDKSTSLRSDMRKATRLVFLVYIVCVVIAIFVQDHTRLLPFGLFNKNKHYFDLLSNIALTLCLTLVAAFALELAGGRDNALGRLGRGAIGSFLILEALLYFLDAGWVSRSPTSRLGGPYYELRFDGDWLFLRKKGAASKEYSTSSMFSYRFPQNYAPRSQTPRVLFLGDSYTEGSGNQAACNYPTVVEQTLIRELGRSVQVMNAGVSGYGPLEAARLLRFLDAKGFAFDAIVFNLYLGNDFTDFLAGTERRVVAGMPFRFPLSSFLRILHPLNSRAFRFALFVKAAADGSLSEHKQSGCEAGGGPGNGERFSQQFLAEMKERLESNYAVDGPSLATEVVRDALESMRVDAQRLGIPFIVVVFPDRIEASKDLQVALDTERRPRSYDLSRLERWTSAALGQIASIQTTELLSSRGGFYLPNETHLNDYGNVCAGEFVGRRLGELLRSRASFRPGGRSGEVSIYRLGARSAVCYQHSTGH